MKKPEDPITVAQARELLGVGKKKFGELFKSGILGKPYIDPLNRRHKWLSRAKVEELKQRSVTA